MRTPQPLRQDLGMVLQQRRSARPIHDQRPLAVTGPTGAMNGNLVGPGDAASVKDVMTTAELNRTARGSRRDPEPPVLVPGAALHSRHSAGMVSGMAGRIANAQIGWSWLVIRSQEQALADRELPARPVKAGDDAARRARRPCHRMWPTACQRWAGG